MLVLGVTRPAQAQLGLGLVPMRSELTMKPGQELSGSLKLSSESGTTTRIRAEINDFYIDNTDTPQFERDLPQEAANSCKTWLSLNPMEIHTPGIFVQRVVAAPNVEKRIERKTVTP